MNHVVRGRPDLPEGMPEAGFQFRVLKAEAKIEQALWLNVLPFKDQLLTHFTEHDSDHKAREGANEGRLRTRPSTLAKVRWATGFGAVMLNGPSASLCIIRW